MRLFRRHRAKAAAPVRRVGVELVGDFVVVGSLHEFPDPDGHSRWQTLFHGVCPSDASAEEVGEMIVEALGVAEPPVGWDPADEAEATVSILGVQLEGSEYWRLVRGVVRVDWFPHEEHVTITPSRRERGDWVSYTTDARSVGFDRERVGGLVVSLLGLPSVAPLESPRLVGPEARRFGPRSAWLAVSAESVVEVAEVMGLASVEAAGWNDALGALTDGGHDAAVVVGGPVDGWVLVVLGPGVWFGFDDALRLEALSERFGEAQKFAVHERIPGVSEIQRWQDGVLVRHLRTQETGELVDLGVADSVEIASRPEGWEPADGFDADEILEIAQAWSTNPALLDTRAESEIPAVLGRTAQTATT